MKERGRLRDVHAKAGDAPGGSARDDARIRADRALVERGLFESRARAQAAIEAGLVRADGRTVARASDLVARGAVLDAEQPFPWVSRGGVKLAAALDVAGLEITGLEALDVGASTGGFTQVLLARGAKRVHAVDVGRGQLHARLRTDPRVVSMEETDIRTLAREALPRMGIVTIDVSFISLRQVLPAALAFAAPSARLVALVKPQFEVGREKLSRGGIVKDAAARAAAASAVEDGLAGLGWHVDIRLPSPIAGGDGNEESLIVARAAG